MIDAFAGDAGVYGVRGSSVTVRCPDVLHVYSDESFHGPNGELTYIAPKVRRDSSSDPPQPTQDLLVVCSRSGVNGAVNGRRGLRGRDPPLFFFSPTVTSPEGWWRAQDVRTPPARTPPCRRRRPAPLSTAACVRRAAFAHFRSSSLWPFEAPSAANDDDPRRDASRLLCLCAQANLVPALRGAKVLGAWVGFRPCRREGVRLELEQGADMPLPGLRIPCRAHLRARTKGLGGDRDAERGHR